MVLSWWQRWLRRQSSGSPCRRSAPGLRRSPTLEALEDRTLLSAGALDPTFGTGGIVKNGGFNDSAAAVLVQPDGKVIVAGMSAGIDTSNFVVDRFTKTGILDHLPGEHQLLGPSHGFCSPLLFVGIHLEVSVVTL